MKKSNFAPAKLNRRAKRHNPGEPITENRRVLKIGKSFYLNLPPEFVELHHIQPGQKIPITADHLLKVIPHSEQ